MSDTVTRDDAGGVATLTLQRPGLSHALRKDLLAAVQAVGAHEAVGAGLITGTGRAFCVGQDLAEHLEELRGNAATSLNVVVEEYNPLILALSELRVPVVVAINGACAGAGLGLALAGDLRIAAAGVKFTTAFTGVGLSSDSALAARLVHCVGGSRAAQLLLTPDPFTTETAEQWGWGPRAAQPEGAGAPGRRRRAGPAGVTGPGGPAGERADGGLPGDEDRAGDRGHRLPGGDARTGGTTADPPRADRRSPRGGRGVPGEAGAHVHRPLSGPAAPHRARC